MSEVPRNRFTVPRNIAGAIVIKDEDIFFLSQNDGSVPAGNQDGYGLYYHDCRYLSGYAIHIDGTSPNALGSESGRGSIAQFEFTNENLQQPDGKTIPQQTLGVTLQRVIDSRECAVHDQFTIENYSVQSHSISLSFVFQTGFDDIFEIRGLHPKRIGRENAPGWQDNVLVFSNDGADGILRRLEIHCEPKPQDTSTRGMEYSLRLTPGERRQINFSLRIIESKQAASSPQPHVSDHQPVAGLLHRRSDEWLNSHASVRSNHALLNEAVRRSLLDLLALWSSLDGYRFFAAGLPWYGALFGRDSLIASLESLAFEPSIAEETVRLLAKYQGTRTDEWRDEQPGKILHELRRGELANLNEIPQTPYYGSVDSTPLFLIVIGEHANWSGDLKLFLDLRPNIERALRWIDRYGDEGENGYLSYATKSSKGLGNQGWKDSGDSIMNADGSLATPPIALVEVQGYVYYAKRLIADLYARSGDPATAAHLRAEANDLKTRFNRDFWLADKQFYAIALQQGNRPAAVISSNPGQALWTGIVDAAKAPAVVRQLMAEDMFGGWGIRTLSTRERRSNPIGYHLGTVWPHDNAIIAAGLHRYGYDEEALQLTEGILQAARHFVHYRLPEVFAGFSRKQFSTPMRYPVACHPQAWAAASVPYLLTSLLGLVPDAFNNRLQILRPVLPENVDAIDIVRVPLGKGCVDLHFSRGRDGSVQVEASNRHGIEVQVRPGPRLEAA